MIERYTIKFGPAVSQKELEKALHESRDTPAHQLNKMRAGTEVVGDFEDLIGGLLVFKTKPTLPQIARWPASQ
jgi:hypothetical protein